VQRLQRLALIEEEAMSIEEQIVRQRLQQVIENRCFHATSALYGAGTCEVAANKVALQVKEQRYAEPCSDCNGWHIGRLEK
jgi:hypothetical protein